MPLLPKNLPNLIPLVETQKKKEKEFQCQATKYLKLALIIDGHEDV